MWFHNVEGRIYLTGMPGRRGWYANLLADPKMTLHLPGGPDLAVTATPVDDMAFRRTAFTAAKTWWYRSQVSVDELVARIDRVDG